jgi:hypothetical protein
MPKTITLIGLGAVLALGFSVAFAQQGEAYPVNSGSLQDGSYGRCSGH